MLMALRLGPPYFSRHRLFQVIVGRKMRFGDRKLGMYGIVEGRGVGFWNLVGIGWSQGFTISNLEKTIQGLCTALCMLCVYAN